MPFPLFSQPKPQFFAPITTVSCGDSSRPSHYTMGMMNEHTHYHIKIKGHLDTRWQSWFDGLTINLTDDGDTILSGNIVDQSALHGMFKKINNLGLILISVNPQSDKEIKNENTQNGR